MLLYCRLYWIICANRVNPILTRKSFRASQLPPSHNIRNKNKRVTLNFLLFLFSLNLSEPQCCIMWHGWGPRDIGHHLLFHSTAHLTDSLHCRQKDKKTKRQKDNNQVLDGGVGNSRQLGLKIRIIEYNVLFIPSLGRRTWLTSWNSSKSFPFEQFLVFSWRTLFLPSSSTMRWAIQSVDVH